MNSIIASDIGTVAKRGFWRNLNNFLVEKAYLILRKMGISQQSHITMGMSLRNKIRLYKRRVQEIESYLSKRPNEWGKFQSEFNQEVNSIFHDIMIFEKANLSAGREDKVYKLKRLFVNRVRTIFVRGTYIKWSLYKPFGYVGDFKIIDDIYQNNPSTTGFDRLFDNYFQMSGISIAVRNRKEDFKRLIVGFINSRQNCALRIMNLASGSCRDIKEIISLDNSLVRDTIFDCYDNDERAIEFAKTLLVDFSQINFFKENALKIAFSKNIDSLINKKYDFIYSAGLFDYFSEKIAIRLVRCLKKLIVPKGNLLISSVRDKYSNPSVHFMEWVGDWNLVYRNEEDFRKIFIAAGFKENEIETRYEQQGIIQYILTSNKI